MSELQKKNYETAGNTNNPAVNDDEFETLETDEKTYKIKARNVILTINEKSSSELENIIKYFEHFAAFQYILVTSHAKPKFHYHMYVQLNEARMINSKYLNGAHVEKCYGSAEQNIKYLKGEDEKHMKLNIKCEVVYENGLMKNRGGRRITDIKNMTYEELDEQDINLLNAIWKIKGPKKTKIDDWHKEIKVYYIFGPSGIGKSKLANDILKRDGYDEFAEVKAQNNFWLGVGGIEMTGAAIYDDFRDNQLPASEFINFIDYNIHNLNYKGGSTLNKFNEIIITSVQSPNLIYQSVIGEPREQWIRRLNIIDLTPRNP